MTKLTGFKQIKTAVFISGRGSNLKSLIKSSKKKNSSFRTNFQSKEVLLVKLNFVNIHANLVMYV